MNTLVDVFTETSKPSTKFKPSTSSQKWYYTQELAPLSLLASGMTRIKFQEKSPVDLQGLMKKGKKLYTKEAAMIR